jgi:hypothetical protein
VAVKARTFFSFGVEQFLGYLVILVVACFTLIFCRFSVTEMERFIKNDELLIRDSLGLALVALTAFFNRSGFLSSLPYLPVTLHAVDVINIHHLLSAGILKPSKSRGLPILFRQMAG